MAVGKTQSEKGESATGSDEAALHAQVEQLRSDLASLTRTLEGLVVDAGREGLESAKGAADNARQRVHNLGEEVTEQISERPLTSALIAFVVGLVLGALFTRQR